MDSDRLRNLSILKWVRVLCAAFTLAIPMGASAVHTTTLHTFTGGHDGTLSNRPLGLIQGDDGSLYGVADDGGLVNNRTCGGVAFKVTLTGIFTSLHEFPCPDQFGNDFVSFVKGSDGNFYGHYLVSDGTRGNYFYRVTPSGAYTVIANLPFFGRVNRFQLGSDGNFYGLLTPNPDHPQGAIYRLTPGGVLSVIHAFSTSESDYDGSGEFASLIVGADGNLYGATFDGGPSGHGVFFRSTTSGALTVLSSFASDVDPELLLQAADGMIYGKDVSVNGSDGYLVKITPTGTVATLPSLAVSSLLQGSDGNLYGHAQTSVFRITSNDTVATLYTFPETYSSPGYPNSAYGHMVLSNDRTAMYALGNTSSSMGVVYRLNLTSPSGGADLSISGAGYSESKSGVVTLGATISNLGPMAATNVVLRVPVKVRTLITGMTSSSCQFVEASGAGYLHADCTIDSLPSGASTDLTVAYQLPAPIGFSALGPSVYSDISDPNLANNTMPTQTVTPPTADLSLAVSGAMDALGQVAYRMTIANTGPLSATTANVASTVPTGATLVASQSDSGCTLSGATLRCDIASLASGVSIDVNATILVPATAQFTESFVVNDANTVDPNTSNNTVTVDIYPAGYIPAEVDVPTLPQWAAVIMGLILLGTASVQSVQHRQKRH